MCTLQSTMPLQNESWMVETNILGLWPIFLYIHTELQASSCVSKLKSNFRSNDSLCN